MDISGNLPPYLPHTHLSLHVPWSVHIYTIFIVLLHLTIQWYPSIGILLKWWSVFSPAYLRHISPTSLQYSFPLMWEWEERNSFDVPTGSTPSIMPKSLLGVNTILTSSSITISALYTHGPSCVHDSSRLRLLWIDAFTYVCVDSSQTVLEYHRSFSPFISDFKILN